MNECRLTVSRAPGQGGYLRDLVLFVVDAYTPKRRPAVLAVAALNACAAFVRYRVVVCRRALISMR